MMTSTNTNLTRLLLTMTLLPIQVLPTPTLPTARARAMKKRHPPRSARLRTMLSNLPRRRRLRVLETRVSRTYSSVTSAGTSMKSGWLASLNNLARSQAAVSSQIVRLVAPRGEWLHIGSIVRKLTFVDLANLSSPHLTLRPRLRSKCISMSSTVVP